MSAAKRSRVSKSRLAASLLPALSLACGGALPEPADDGAGRDSSSTVDSGFFQEWQPPNAPAEASPLVGREPCGERVAQRRAFFGDLHTHTSFSFDALLRGGFQTPDDAYRFARGEPIPLSGNRAAQLERPLDFAAVTDHAEWLGEVGICSDSSGSLYDAPACRGLRGEGSGEDALAWREQLLQGRGDVLCGPDGSRCRASLVTAWQKTQRAAEEHYDRSADCSFTTFVGWEHTRSPARSKAHRNVILRNEVAPELPITWIDAPAPEDLWRKLKRLCNDTGSGCEALTIPHNPNVSNGQMFAVDWSQWTLEEQRDRASMQAELEPLLEMMQAKGDSECRRGLWNVVPGEDELCDFEKVRFIDGERPPDCLDGSGAGGLDGEGCQSRLDFARYALIEGLALEERLGVNPLQLGLMASTDGHNGAPGDTDEFDYQGQNSDVDSSLRNRLETDAYAPHKLRNPGGLVGIWAEENTRDALFDAMKRKEVFGTSGVRIRPRFYGTWTLNGPEAEALCSDAGLVAELDRIGVPMGGTLPPAERSASAPTFVVSALADPGTAEHPGGLLQRLQIVKGWVGDQGVFHEQIVDVVGDGGNGAGVDPQTCQPHGPGARSLCGAWTDPSFDPAASAVYYARILENPSCRWNARQCAELPTSERPAACDDPEVPRTIQERAWTSPIWYRAP